MTDSLADQTAARQFTVKAGEDGRPKILLDGNEIQSQIMGYQISANGRDPLATVLLEVAGQHALAPQFDGLARVGVQMDDPGPAAAAFLAAIDPQILEQAALNRPDLADGSLTESMLRQLIDWANGRP